MTRYAREGADELGWTDWDIYAALRELVDEDFLRIEVSERHP